MRNFCEMFLKICINNNNNKLIINKSDFQHLWVVQNNQRNCNKINKRWQVWNEARGLTLPKDMGEESDLHWLSEQQHNGSHLDLGEASFLTCPNRWHCLIESTRSMPILQDQSGQVGTTVQKQASLQLTRLFPSIGSVDIIDKIQILC